MNVTHHLHLLIRDIVARVPSLSAIDPDRLLVFARHGRSEALGPYATCHALTLPDSEPGYHFWRDTATGRITRRTRAFILRSPEVFRHNRRVDHLISFSLPRFFDQPLEGTHKAAWYPGAPAWVARLDTVVHELHHIDPRSPGIRRVERADGQAASGTHSRGFYQEVAALVQAYLDTQPDADVLEVLQHDFATLRERHGAIRGLTFRTFPVFPRRYRVPVDESAGEAPLPDVPVLPWTAKAPQTTYTDADLQMRVFDETRARRCPWGVSAQPAGADEAAAPVGGIEPLDAHHAA